MLSVSKVSAGMAADYYTKEGDYYTRSLNERDRWGGLLSKEIGLDGKRATKENYAAQREVMINDLKRNEVVGFDLTFSMSKSESIACAHDAKTRKDILDSMDEAIEITMKYVEDNYTFAQVRKNGKDQLVKTGNLSYATFHHQFSRANDPDGHVHVYGQNATMYKGKMYALNFTKLMKEQNDIGFFLRRERMRILQEKGYNCVVTDSRNGFFELAGFDRDIIERYSTRRNEILEAAKEHGDLSTDGKQRAALMTRKGKTAIDVDKKYEEIRQKEFVENGYKLYRHGKEVDFDGNEICHRHCRKAPPVLRKSYRRTPSWRPWNTSRRLRLQTSTNGNFCTGSWGVFRRILCAKAARMRFGNYTERN